jgi:hypothetical protein
MNSGRSTKLFRTSAIIAALVVAFAVSCKKKGADDSTDLITLLTLSGLSDARAHEALVLVPSVMTGSTSSPTGNSIINTKFDTIPQGAAATSLQLVYAPVKASLYIGKQLLNFGGRLITAVENYKRQYESNGVIIGTVTARYTDFSDPGHPTKIAKVSKDDASFGADGWKVEIWWDNTGADALRDGKKQVELSYRLNGEDIDGLMFFRYVPPERPASFAYGRVEFKKSVASGQATRTAYMNISNYFDFESETGNAIFLMTEDPNGTVTVSGGYTMKGQEMPFWEQNYTGWGATDQRVYLFNGAGSTAMGKAVVQVSLPLSTETVAATADPFSNATNWSLGELFTDGLLYWMEQTAVPGLGGSTYLQLVNLIVNPDLTTSSDQAALQVALNQLQSADPSAQYGISYLQTVTNIKNPVYFQKTFFGSALIGQLDTDGLDAVVGADGVAQYATLQALLSSGAFPVSVADICAMDIGAGTGVLTISGHTGITAAWTNIDEAAPSI